MNVDAQRFAGEVFDANGVALGEARLWASAERSSDGASWRGWLNIADLSRLELAAGRYRMCALDGWEAEFEPLVPRPGRIFETDLLPIVGVGEPPWPAPTDESSPRYVPVWGDSPSRSPHDPCRMGDLPPLQLEAAEAGVWLTEVRIEEIRIDTE